MLPVDEHASTSTSGINIDKWQILASWQSLSQRLSGPQLAGYTHVAVSASESPWHRVVKLYIHSHYTNLFTYIQSGEKRRDKNQFNLNAGRILALDSVINYAWQSIAYSPLGVVVSPPSEYLWNTPSYCSLQFLAAKSHRERSWSPQWNFRRRLYKFLRLKLWVHQTESHQIFTQCTEMIVN